MSRGIRILIVSLVVTAAGLLATASAHAGTVVVKLEAQPDSNQGFTYTTGGGLWPAGENPPASFFLADRLGSVNKRTFSDVPAGSGYSVSQGAAAGWTLSSSTCDNGSPVSNITVGATETVTCTFTNQSQNAGSLTVVLDARPNADTRFVFRVDGPTAFGGILLQDNGNPADGISNEHTVAVEQGVYSLSLRDRDDGDWTQNGVFSGCSDGSSVGNVMISPGEHVTCTMTYDAGASAITVLLDSRPNSSQFFNFTYTEPGQSPVNFSLTDGFNASLASRRFIVQPGSGYSVAESVPAGWDLTSMICDDGSSPSNINVAPSEQVTCTFLNDKLGAINVFLDAQPESPQEFSYSAGGGLSPSSFTLSEPIPSAETSAREFENVPPGTYSITQQQAAGWDAPIVNCSGGENPSSISISYNETVNCTFTNRISGGGHLTLKLDAVPDAETHFIFRVNGPTPYGGIALQDDGDPNDGAFNGPQHTVDAVPGTYNLSLRRVDSDRWGLQAASCSDGSPFSAVEIGPGEDVTCTFTYTNQNIGKIIVVNDFLGNCVNPGPFTFTFNWPNAGPEPFSLQTGCNRPIDVPAGSGYSVTNGPTPSGWNFIGASCNDGSSTVSNIDVSAGETVVCTFDYRRWGRVEVVLDSQPNSAQQFSYTTGGGLTPSSFTLSDPGGSARSLFLDPVPPGSGYSVSQAVQPGWTLASATCDNGSPVTNISVPLEATVHCTFVNQQAP